MVAEVTTTPDRRDTEGSIGIGAMIVFIALILVAAVASTIIIKTAEELQRGIGAIEGAYVDPDGHRAVTRAAALLPSPKVMRADAAPRPSPTVRDDPPPPQVPPSKKSGGASSLFARLAQARAPPPQPGRRKTALVGGDTIIYEAIAARGKLKDRPLLPLREAR